MTSLSCASPGTCAAGGEYQDRDGGNHPFLADSVNGTWGNAKNVDFTGFSIITGFGFDFRVNSVSCTAPGECAAGLVVPVADSSTPAGRSEEAFVADESAGHWGTPQPVPGIQELNAGNFAIVNSVSCRAPGSCVAGGAFEDSRGVEHPFLATESGGTWGTGAQVPGVSGLPGINSSGGGGVDVVSCLPAGPCTAAGFYDVSAHLQPFVAEESGSWNAQSLPGAAGQAVNGIFFPNVACASSGNCAFVMGSRDASDTAHVLASVETNGVWGGTQRIPGIRDVQSAGGWTVSCDPGGTCAFGGLYDDKQFTQRAFIAERSPATATGLTLSSPGATVGHEQSERLSVKVTPRTGGTPGGKVVIKSSSVTVCTITLAKAKGACTLKPRQLRRGTYHLTATYGGSPVYAASTSGKKTLTVTR